MANPVLVRCTITPGKYYAYVPADKSGRYWARHDFTAPLRDMTNYSKYLALSQVCFGQVHPGQIVFPRRMNATAVNIVSTDVSEKQIVVATDLTTTFTVGRVITVAGTVNNDGNYCVTSSAYSSPNTTITVGTTVAGTDGGAAGTVTPGEENWVERPGYWSSAGAGVWKARGCYAGTLSAGYATVTIPATHNVIKILVDAYHASGSLHGDVMCLGWDDSTTWSTASKDGLAITEQDLDNGTDAHKFIEYTVATNAVPGTRKLRIWRKAVTASCGVVICSVRSWDTSVAGDPSTAVDGIAVGHDMVDTIANSDTGGKLDVRDADMSMAILTADPRAVEWAIRTGPPAGTLGFSGTQHYLPAGGDYPALYAADTFTNGPEIRLGNGRVVSGGAFDSTAHPQGKVLTDTAIHIRSIIYPAWGSATPPKMIYGFTIDRTGLLFSILLQAQTGTGGDGAVEFDDSQAMGSSQYAVMFPAKAGEAPYFKIPNSDTEYSFANAADMTVVTNPEFLGVSQFDVYFPARSAKVACTMIGSAFGLLFLNASDKLYCQMGPGNWGIDIPAAWSDETTYAAGAVVSYTPTDTQRVYVSLQGSNTNHAPEDGDTAYWRKGWVLPEGGEISFGGRYEVSFEDPAFNAGWSRTRYGNPVV